MATNPKKLSEENLNLNLNSRLFKIYKDLKYESLKCNTYFQVYEELFNDYIGKKITFVEIGVLHGGSLFMWQKYFGDKARIIGIDLNPEAKNLEKHGFEIHIGSQSDVMFWKDFYSKVGNIDILLDDGGHENSQQIITLNESIQNINDGGIILTEDTHTSYLKELTDEEREIDETNEGRANGNIGLFTRTCGEAARAATARGRSPSRSRSRRRVGRASPRSSPPRPARSSSAQRAA